MFENVATMHVVHMQQPCEVQVLDWISSSNEIYRRPRQLKSPLLFHRFETDIYFQHFN